MLVRAEDRLNRLINSRQQALLRHNRVGLEKENLRISPRGCLSQSDHPEALGSALAHSQITTDYSESLLELVTPPMGDIESLLAYLADLQTFVQQHIGEELLWAASMPCICTPECGIRIAEYGHSNIGLMKHIYRQGLGYRYGRMMQVIAGVHFNFSVGSDLWPVYQAQEGHKGDLQAFIDANYFAMIRNLQRFSWLPMYLFGASPAGCRNFFKGQETDLEEYDRTTLYAPCAASLRMSNRGYHNSLENKHGLHVSYDSLAAYVASLSRATETPYAEYEALGVKVDGTYRQLNPNILQLENEYYATVRPKQPAAGLEKPTQALWQRGVRYVELRSLDLNPFVPLGVDAHQLRFLEAFMLYCLFHDSPRLHPEERGEIDYNQQTVCARGRCPRLMLQRDGQSVELAAWAAELMERMEPFCEVLDQGRTQADYTEALLEQKAKLWDVRLTPSSLVLAAMRAHDEGHNAFGLRLSREHEQYFRERRLAPERLAELQRLAAESRQSQAAIEAGDEQSFDAFLAAYFAQPVGIETSR